MRFRTAGANWERRPWTLAPCLVVLGQQISVLHPRGHPADGTVASRPHDAANPSSDHRPKPYSGSGIVRALDAGENTEDDAYNMAESIRLSRDHRISYVIHEGKLFSSYPSGGVPAFTWRPYSGAPHDNHVHFSTLASADNDTRPWRITANVTPPEDPTMKPPDWARTATQWHIDRGIYTEKAVDDVDEELEFHRQTVFRHRFYNAIRGEFGSGGGQTIDLRLQGRLLGQ